MPCPRLILTPGEPAGIGPELAVRAAQSARNYELVAVASPELLAACAEKLQRPLTIRELEINAAPRATEASELVVAPIQLAAPAHPGQLDPRNAAYVIACLQRAHELCLSGPGDALVTGPVQKSVINDAGIAFTGHTEFFAEQSRCTQVVMMLATEGLRVALATTHLPLNQVANSIRSEDLRRTLRIIDAEMRDKYGIQQARILVCGLNPHAGEGGHLGREEIDVIAPCLESLRAEGMNIIGPLPADTVFTPPWLERADVVLAMYHDQGLPVLKYKGFGRAVNITLGLPYIRTSVDHGTALDLAGRGIADLGSLEAALAEAARLAALRVSN